VTGEQLRQAGVRALALVLIDNGGIARMKCVSVDRAEHAAAHGIGWSKVWGLSLGDDSFAHHTELYSPSGELRLRADLDAAALLGGAPGWAWAPVDHREKSGEPWPGCQRGFLRRMTAAAADLSLEIQAAWELEWVVGGDGPDGFEPLHPGPGYGAVTFDLTGDYMLALFEALAESGIVPEQVHPEYANGQMELSLPVREPVRACDESILARHVIRVVGGREGWRTSFSPRVVAGSVGNGAHLHFSVWREGENQLAGGEGPAGLRAAGEAFVAGVLGQLPALTAIGAPLALSYARLAPSRWAGVYACWGDENREAALRLEGTGSPDAACRANVEWKSVDGAANPYLALGALIAAGLDGVVRQLALPPPVSADPAMLDEAEHSAAGIARLPQALADSAELLAGSRVLREAMGEYLHDRVVAVRRAEIEAAAGLDEESLTAKYRWRF
jgi:glutamine synthetase